MDCNIHYNFNWDIRCYLEEIYYFHSQKFCKRINFFDFKYLFKSSLTNHAIPMEQSMEAHYLKKD